MKTLLIKIFAVMLLVSSSIITAHAAPPISEAILAGTNYFGGNGDSFAPILSADGRYVLFASAAKNLTTNILINPFTPKLNVYLRDRISGTTILVSENYSGSGGGNEDSFPAEISANGQYALFESAASNLIAGDANNFTDVFLRDIVNGVTWLVSTNYYGGFGNGNCRNSVMTPDGRYIAFTSEATNLVASDTNGYADIFVRDMQLGSTICASFNSMRGTSDLPDITPDGHYLVFFSSATNLVPGVTNTSEIYIRDLMQGKTTWVSQFPRANSAAYFTNTLLVSYNHAISETGPYVVYETASAGSSQGVIFRYNPSNGLTDVISTNAAGEPVVGNELLHHTVDISGDGEFITYPASYATGYPPLLAIYSWDANTQSNSLVSGDTNNAIVTLSTSPYAISDRSGRYVAFISNGGQTGTAPLIQNDIYLRDLLAGTTQLVDLGINGVTTGSTVFSTLRISTNGTVVSFDSLDGNLVANPNKFYDVFARNMASNALELTSITQPGTPASVPNGNNFFSGSGSVSSNGQFVAFLSEANNLATKTSLGFRDLFVRDRFAGTNVLASVDISGATSGSGSSGEPSISANGQRVAFSSLATNLVSGDTSRFLNVFARDFSSNQTYLVSANLSETGSGNAASYSPLLSGNGRYILFHSIASNLGLGITSTNYENIYLRDLSANTTQILTTNTIRSNILATMTPDARYILLGSSTLQLWNNSSNTFTQVTNIPATNAIAISADGSKAAYTYLNHLYATSLATKQTWTLGSVSNLTLNSRYSMQFSADAHYLVFSGANSAGTNQVYVYDFIANTNILVSQSSLAISGGNANSDSPAISADGRFIAYRSVATNLVANDTNGLPDIFLYDQVKITNTLVTTSVYGTNSAGGRSMNPGFSADSRTLFFQSWASDLTTQDPNYLDDVFVAALFAPTLAAFPINIAYSPGQGAIISWLPTTNATYSVQFKTALTTTWQTLNRTITNNGTNASVIDPSALVSPGRFYRVFGQ